MSARKIVSVRQLELLLNFMENNNDLAHGRVRSKEGRVRAFKLWQQCAKILNAADVANTRTPKEWSKVSVLEIITRVILTFIIIL